MVIRNSIDASKTGNCTNFEESLCDSSTFLDISWKHKQQGQILDDTQSDGETVEMERMLIEVDRTDGNELKDNILYYIAGFIVRKLLPMVKCTNCWQQLILKSSDYSTMIGTEYPVYAKFTQLVQKGGLMLPSVAVLRLVKAAEVIFKRRVVGNETGISTEKNLNLKIELAVAEQFGSNIFTNVGDHFYEHQIGQERDHLSSLMRLVIRKYVDLRLKSYGKRYTEMIAHKNLPSSRHELTKTILFLNQ